MSQLENIIKGVKHPISFKEFELNLNELLNYYHENSLRQIGDSADDVVIDVSAAFDFLHEHNVDASNIKDNEVESPLDEFIEKLKQDTALEKANEQRLNFTKMTIDLKNLSYNNNRDIIDSYLQLIVNGANLYKASFDLVGKKIMLEIVEYCKRKIWLVTFSVNDRKESKLVKNALVDARAKRREKMMAMLTCKTTYPEDEGLILPDDVRTEYKSSGIISQSTYNSIDDFFHWNKIGSRVESFYMRNLALEAHVGEVHYDKNDNTFYITVFNYFYDLHIEEVRLLMKSVEDINVLGGLLKNLDTYRDRNLYFIQTQKIPDEHDEGFDDFDFSDFDPANYGFKYFLD